MSRKSIKEILGKINVRINPSCCTHFSSWDYEIGYVIFPVFKAAKCCNCGDIQLICNKFWIKIFKIFFQPLWNGELHTYDGYTLNLKDAISNQVFIINGPPQVGKDTFVKFCQAISPFVQNFSTSSLTKIICAACGWDGEKTPETRKFLSDLKDLLTKSPWGNIPFNKLKEDIDKMMGQIIFIHVREPEEIDLYKKTFDAKTILVDDGKARPEASNHADADVYNYNYDIVIENKGTLSDLRQKAEDFLAEVMAEKIKKFTMDGDGNYPESTIELMKMIENNFKK